jgi:hypothetical protein
VKDRQFDAKEFLVPSRIQRQLIVGDHKSAPLHFVGAGQNN